MSRTPSPLRIRLDDDRRERMHVSIRQFFGEHFDDAISDFKIGELLDFFVSELGPPVYNQAIQDARRYLQEKLTDLEGEFYEPDEPYVR